MVTRSEPGYAWDFCGGHLAIDFTNTVGSRRETREEHFKVYEDVLSWAETRRVIARAEAQRLRPCADTSCAWLFMDTTRNRTRRWCDMKSCGNRDKVRRFRAQPGRA